MNRNNHAGREERNSASSFSTFPNAGLFGGVVSKSFSSLEIYFFRFLTLCSATCSGDMKALERIVLKAGDESTSEDNREIRSS